MLLPCVRFLAERYLCIPFEVQFEACLRHLVEVGFIQSDGDMVRTRWAATDELAAREVVSVYLGSGGALLTTTTFSEPGVA